MTTAANKCVTTLEHYKIPYVYKEPPALQPVPPPLAPVTDREIDHLFTTDWWHGGASTYRATFTDIEARKQFSEDLIDASKKVSESVKHLPPLIRAKIECNEVNRQGVLRYRQVIAQWAAEREALLAKPNRNEETIVGLNNAIKHTYHLCQQLEARVEDHNEMVEKLSTRKDPYACARCGETYFMEDAANMCEQNHCL
jgi:hypothetical protein